MSDAKFRPRKKSLSSGGLLPGGSLSSAHYRRPGGFSLPGVHQIKKYLLSINSETRSNVAVLVSVVLVFVYLFSGYLWHPARHYEVRGASPELTKTTDPIIVPDMKDIPYLKSNVPVKAPGDATQGDSQRLWKGRWSEENHVISSYVFDADGADYSPDIVMVVGLDYESYHSFHLAQVLDNRREYATAHGYGLYARFLQDFRPDYSDAQYIKISWAKLAVMRAAMLAYPRAKYFWYLDQNAVLMNPLVDLYDDIIKPAALEKLMLRGQPITRDSDLIKSYTKTKANKVSIILTQDELGLSSSSFILKNDDYAKALIEFWSDPAYRSYGEFKRGDVSALNHLEQWHPVFLSRTAIIPTRKLAAMAKPKSIVFEGRENAPPVDLDLKYRDGDFVVTFHDCNLDASVCAREYDRYYEVRGRITSIK